MLARLQDIDGIAHAETDVTGDFLRLSFTEVSALARATHLLLSLGYIAEPVTDVDVSVWYDAASVGELSRIEADVIAGRVLRLLRRSNEVDADAMGRLRSGLVDALHRCLLATSLTARPSPGLRTSCAMAARDSAVPIVGSVVADQLATLVDADMGDDHKPRS